MVIEKKLGTEDNPDIIETSRSVEVIPEKTRQEEIRDAANILVTEEGVLLDDEQVEEEAPQEDFFANLAEFLDEDDLTKLSTDLTGSIKGDF